MRTVKYSCEKLQALFYKEKVLTISTIKSALGTKVKMTAIRKLHELSSVTSYSHAGKYYTLNNIAKYGEHGLWDFDGIRFSINGTLIDTVQNLIELSDSGYFLPELVSIVKVQAQETLLKLYRQNRIYREKVDGNYIYLSIAKKSEQLKNRKQLITANAQGNDIYFASGFGSEEIRESLQLFLTILNEKQKRLYVGFESMRQGYGGDTIMSKLTGMNVKTIAKGREELLAHNITVDRIRQKGGGRNSLKKN